MTEDWQCTIPESNRGGLDALALVLEARDEQRFEH